LAPAPPRLPPAVERLAPRSGRGRATISVVSDMRTSTTATASLMMIGISGKLGT
jgi:hypothetical protein